MYIIISKHKFSDRVDITKKNTLTIKDIYKDIPNQLYYNTIVINTEKMEYTTNGINWKYIENEI